MSTNNSVTVCYFVFTTAYKKPIQTKHHTKENDNSFKLFDRIFRNRIARPIWLTSRVILNDWTLDEPEAANQPICWVCLIRCHCNTDYTIFVVVAVAANNDTAAAACVPVQRIHSVFCLL